MPFEIHSFGLGSCGDESKHPVDVACVFLLPTKAFSRSASFLLLLPFFFSLFLPFVSPLSFTACFRLHYGLALFIKLRPCLLSPCVVVRLKRDDGGPWGTRALQAYQYIDVQVFSVEMEQERKCWFSSNVPFTPVSIFPQLPYWPFSHSATVRQCSTFPAIVCLESVTCTHT